jgi:peptidoglycan/LPS O-acetylase OafA/YrhL
MIRRRGGGAVHEPGRRSRRRRWAAVGLVAVKLALVAVALLLPSGVALSVGAAHGVVMLLLLAAAVVALLVARRRGRTFRELLAHVPPARHRLIPSGRRQADGGEQR